jgi:flagellar M-ring protein FliF
LNLTAIREAWSGLELRSQVTLIGGVVAVLGALFFFYSFASTTSYSTLVSGMTPSQTGEAEQALAGAGVAYRVASGGTEIDVPAGELSQAQIAIAEKGVLNGSQNSFSSFDKTSLGITDFQQQVQYQAALQDEIAQTIDQIQGVNSSSVELVIPDNTLFQSQQTPATAAVLVNGGSELDPQTIEGIAHLVSSSVTDLSPQNVTITDQTGSLLWPTAESGGSLSAESKLQADNLYSQQLSAEVNALLTSTLGPDKAIASVHADLNANQTSLEQVTYGKKGTPLSTQTQSETLQSKNGGTQLPSGAAANAATAYAAATTNSTGSSNYKNATSTTNYGVAKTITRSTLAPGQVNTLNIALLVDSTVPAAEVTLLQKSVASLVGFNAKRGDTMSVSRIPFAKPVVTKAVAASPLAMLGNPISLAKDVGVGLAALIFLFLMRRSLKRRESEASVPSPRWLRELQGGMTLAELEGAPRQLPAPTRKDLVEEQIAEIAESSPQAIATQVAQWMKE